MKAGLLEGVVRPFVATDIRPPRKPITSTTSAVAAGGPTSIVLGGIAASGALISLTFSSTAIAGSPITVSYALSPTDDLSNGVVGIVNAVNNDPNLKLAGIIASGVSGDPFQFTITQPDSLNPPAQITASATLTVTLSVSSDAVSIQIGRGKVSAKTMNGSYSNSVSTYNLKWPREWTLDEILANNLPPYNPPPFNPRI